jgi:hypothetical protein
MTQTLAAKDIDIRYLIDNFGLKLAEDEQFFGEWQDDLPEITDLEKQLLDRLKTGFINLLTYPPLLENVVKLSVVGPLLFIAGFYLSPFQVKAEKSIQIQDEDDGVIIEGRLDILLLKDQFWVMVIESKKLSFSIEEGLGQLLAYMWADPQPDKPTFGMITTGGNFVFVKLVRGENPHYALSNQFTTRNLGNELYSVLQIFKRLSQLA